MRLYKNPRADELYTSVTQDFFSFDYESQKAILDALFLYNIKDHSYYVHHLGTAKLFLKLVDNIRSFKDYYNSLSSNEAKTLQTSMCTMALNDSAYFHTSECYYDRVYDYDLNGYGMGNPLFYMAHKLSTESKSTSQEKIKEISFDIVDFIDVFESQLSSGEEDDSRDLENLNDYFDTYFEESYFEDFDNNPAVIGLRETMDENIKFYRTKLSKTALEIFDKLSKKDQIIIMMSLPMLTKEALQNEAEDGYITHSKVNGKIVKISINCKQKAVNLASEFTKTTQREVPTRAKKKFPKIRERKKQVVIR